MIILRLLLATQLTLTSCVLGLHFRGKLVQKKNVKKIRLTITHFSFRNVSLNIICTHPNASCFWGYGFNVRLQILPF